MIDRVHLSRTLYLDTGRFNTNIFTYQRTSEDSIRYAYNYHGVSITYSTFTRKLEVKGRLYNLCDAPNRVGTLDSLWAGATSHADENYHQDLDDVLDGMNDLLYRLTGHVIDIRRFDVTYIEICFNLTTPYVDDYIKLFNARFEAEQKTRYKNYVLEKDLLPYTSFYVKTATDFKRNRKKVYVVNFYNKLDQLRNIAARNRQDRYSAEVTAQDLDLARNVLRMELQCGHHYRKRIIDRYNRGRVFSDYLDINFCSSLIKEKYRDFIDDYGYNSFYWYNDGAEIIDNAVTLSAKDKRRLREYWLSLSQGSVDHHFRAPSTRKKYNDMLASLGVHSFIIQRRHNITAPMLRSPLYMLDEHVQRLQEQRQQYIQRFAINDRQPLQEDVYDEYMDIDIGGMEDLFEE